MLMTNQQSAELTEPGIGSLHDPAAFVASHFASVFIPPPLIVLSVGRDQFDGTLLQSFTQRIGIVAGVGDYTLRLLPRAPLRARDAGQTHLNRYMPSGYVEVRWGYGKSPEVLR